MSEMTTITDGNIIPIIKQMIIIDPFKGFALVEPSFIRLIVEEMEISFNARPFQVINQKSVFTQEMLDELIGIIEEKLAEEEGEIDGGGEV